MVSESTALPSQAGLLPSASTGDLEAPLHGGDVRAASQRYGIAMEHWLDLSTGINPDAYPVPAIPDRYFRHLPDKYNSDLIAAAKQYYRCANLVPAAGSQRVIELLPTLRPHCRVAIPDTGYQEHHYHWQRCGHSVVFYNSWQPEQLTQKIHAGDVDVVVLINPCNPTAAMLDRGQVEHWRKLLAERGGWLVIDEAFVDPYSENSFAANSHLPAVIVLRSLGKFFGLAGVRVGFVLAADELTHIIAKNLGPWSVTGPSQYLAVKALTDTQWQRNAHRQLTLNNRWMQEILRAQLYDSVDVIVSATLFVSVLAASEIAHSLYNALATRGILVRLWQLPGCNNKTALLRFGLIDEQDHQARQRLQNALSEITLERITDPAGG